MLVSQLSSTLPSSAGDSGKGSPSSPEKKKKKELIKNAHQHQVAYKLVVYGSVNIHCESTNHFLEVGLEWIVLTTL